MITKYKLLNRGLTTYGGYKWTPYKWHEVSGKGDLCGPGWLHCYDSPYLAVLLNPIHADVKNPVLWECHVLGQSKHDNGLKSGYTGMSLVRECEVPIFTREQRVAFGICCSLAVYTEPKFIEWANNWLHGKDRSAAAAAAAAGAAAAAWVAGAAAGAAAARSAAVGAARSAAAGAAGAAWAAAAGARSAARSAAGAAGSIDLSRLALAAYEFERVK